MRETPDFATISGLERKAKFLLFFVQKAFMQTTNFLTLPDKRQLAYAEFGEPNGHPVLYFHGGLSCRLEPLLWRDETIKSLGLRFIAPDRPGIGQSDFLPNRGFSDSVKDIECLADALGLDKFSTMGISGGGGYPLACAALIPARLYAAVIVSGAWQADAIAHFPRASRLAWRLIRQFPGLNILTLKLKQQSFKKSSKQLMAMLEKQFPPVDYAVLKSPTQIDIFRQISLESMCLGVQGTAWDIQLYLKHWDFSLDKIQMPLKYFHGGKDMTIPLSLAKQVVMELPTAQLAAYPEEGHLSIIVNQFETIAKSLVNAM